MESKYTNLAGAPTLRGGPFLSFDVAPVEKGTTRVLGEKKEKQVDVFRGAAGKGEGGNRKNYLKPKLIPLINFVSNRY